MCLGVAEMLGRKADEVVKWGFGGAWQRISTCRRQNLGHKLLCSNYFFEDISVQLRQRGRHFSCCRPHQQDAAAAESRVRFPGPLGAVQAADPMAATTLHSHAGATEPHD